ncbi:YcnI family protein [Bdellovibrio sp. NC01]|uniref:YcnI family protein n=1 Tax=Bdellovibrio sp. NC01 TaxID=2220073 RepID=UPI00115C24A0|nr:YcnI family protein [Bdellovibrio sp. NC01]QDK37252.1 hypothetical protein DOE51_06435 [Bdellovibrio sp. NC01]
MKKLIATTLLSLLSTTAFAHVSLESPTAETGSYYKAVLRIPHGCDGTATNSITIQLPNKFLLAKPMPKAGWNLDIANDAAGNVTEIKYSGGNLPDAFYEEFIFRGKIAAPAGSTLYFKVAQVCEKGHIDWFDIPAAGQDEHSLEAPAASLKITAGK